MVKALVAPDGSVFLEGFLGVMTALCIAVVFVVAIPANASVAGGLNGDNLNRVHLVRRHQSV